MTTETSLTIDAQLLEQSLRGAKQAGVDIKALLQEQHIALETLSTKGARVPMHAVIAIHRQCSNILEDETLGLLEKPTPVGFFQFLALSVLHAGTLGRALHRAVKFNNMFCNSFHLTLDKQATHTHIIVNRIPGHKTAGPYATDSLLTALHRFSCWLCNEPILPVQVDLDFSKPSYYHEYPFIYHGAPVTFEQPASRLIFDSALMELPIVQNESSLKHYIARRPLDLYLATDATGEFSSAVRKYLKTSIVQTAIVPSLEEVAANQDMSPERLRRRLKAENTSFKDIKSQVRRDVAIHYLETGDFSIEDISFKTGYSEPAAFIRAFKSWTGYTPLQFQHGANNTKRTDPDNF